MLSVKLNFQLVGVNLKLNNKAFLLYDALVALLILTSSIIFFTQAVNINYVITNQVNSKFETLAKIQQQMYESATWMNAESCYQYEGGNNEQICI